MADALLEDLSRKPTSDEVDVCAQEDLEALLNQVIALALRLRQAAGDSQIPEGLPVGGKLVMEVLARHGTKTVPQIARTRLTSRQNIQVLVNRLVTEGHVNLLPNPAHKRSPFVQLTEQGRVAVERLLETEAGFEQKLRTELSKGDVLTATEVLGRIRELLAGKARVPTFSHDQTTSIRNQSSLDSVDRFGRDTPISSSLPEPSPSKAEEFPTNNDLPVNLL